MNKSKLITIQCKKCKIYTTVEVGRNILTCPSCNTPFFLSINENKEKESLLATKYDGDKERFDLIPPQVLIDIAQVYTFGAKKYADRNWEKGMKWGRVFAAIMRHLWKFWRGEDKDEESGLSHLAHAAWGCMTLIHYSRYNKDLDDRSTYLLHEDSK